MVNISLTLVAGGAASAVQVVTYVCTIGLGSRNRVWGMGVMARAEVAGAGVVALAVCSFVLFPIHASAFLPPIATGQGTWFGKHGGFVWLIDQTC